MRRVWFVALLIAALASGWTAGARAQSSAPPARQLKISFDNGKVTVIASNVTAREIMAEWARVCGCYVQGADKLTSGVLMPLQFENEPEATVLASLLRSAGGYALKPKPLDSKSPSMYGSISIFAVSRGTAPAYTPSSSPVAAPLVTGGTPDDEIPPVTPVANPQTPAQTNGQRPGGPAVPIIPAPSPGTSTGTGSSTTTTTGRGRG